MNRIGIVDNNNLFRLTLRSFVNNIRACQVSFDFSNLKDFESRLFPGMVNTLVVDICRFTGSEWECLRKIVHHFPEIRILVLSDDISRANVMKVIELGISGFYSKEVCPGLLQDVIISFGKKKKPIDIKLGVIVRERVMNNMFFSDPYSNSKVINFTKREIQILSLICQEMTSPEISNELCLSVRTVDTHRRRLIEKCNKKNILGVVLHALSLNIPLIKSRYPIIQKQVINT